jgi:hypothetical protein
MIIQRKLYALLDRNLLKVKQVMENHMSLLVFTMTTSMKDLLSKIILLV